ncbi:hypothetical protein [Sulfitobacter guttiformis]|uniref:Uncharacterized protein n=1 Tax=Sulfitobacter guttiformis TaxID=74349 RepID=A0A420DHV6_9RHOB|nr:hypothetical protein [Sulfitobacter guttiformis]KIN72448.1 hypothetical protein Z949_1623 [Sulfitobacter guttiformis KCTC 32187]RKE93800.1 hypothetical protein C8N30_2896 [Sulfitobacter guttiformis]
MMTSNLPLLKEGEFPLYDAKAGTVRYDLIAAGTQQGRKCPARVKSTPAVATYSEYSYLIADRRQHSQPLDDTLTDAAMTGNHASIIEACL